MSEIAKVDVTWFDPQSHNGWLSLDDIYDMELKPMYARGWLIEETNKYIKVALNVSSEGDRASDILILPKQLIYKVKRGVRLSI